ncbi:MAG: hypothetical protein R6V85_07820 [Polyangia bacterium]
MSVQSRWILVLGLGLALVAGCGKEAGLETAAPEKPAAGSEQPTQAEKPPAGDGATAAETEVGEAELLARVSRARSMLEAMHGQQTIEMKKRPELGKIAEVLIKAGAGRVGYLMSPDGERFGLTARGDGQKFGETVADLVGELFNKDAGKKAALFGHFNEWKAIYFSVQFGKAPIARVGVESIPRGKVEVALEEEGVPKAEIDRLLAPAADGGNVVGMGLIIDPRRGISISVATEPAGAVAALGVDEKAVEGAQVVIERMAGFEDLNLLRRPGLEGSALIEWQSEQGFGNEAARRLAAIHSSLGTEKPATIIWEAGKLANTVVYDYSEKTAEMGSK